MKKFVMLLTIVLFDLVQSCLHTIVGVGADATVDASTIVTHNDDSTSADFRLWIIPGQNGQKGRLRFVIDPHNYGDFGKYPEVKDYGNGMLVSKFGAPETYAYFHSRHSFINERRSDGRAPSISINLRIFARRPIS